MRQKTGLSREQHTAIAERLRAIRTELMGISQQVTSVNNITSKASKAASSLTIPVDKLRCELDNAWYADIDGHEAISPYYGHADPE